MSRVTDVQEIRLHDTLRLFSFLLLYWDHALTLDDEIQYCWRRPKTRSSFWFFANRYIAFFVNLPVIFVGAIDLPAKGCKRFNTFRQVHLLVTEMLVCIILTLRVSALYERKYVRILLGCGSVLLAAACYAIFSQKGNSTSQSGCKISNNRESAIRLAGSWEALFVYDLIMFGMIVRKTYTQGRGFKWSWHSLTDLVLRDGAMYFGIMTLCNLANILTFYFLGGFARGSLSTFASNMSVTMVSRLMLNLHQVADHGIYSTFSRREPTDNVELDTLWSTDMQATALTADSSR